MSLPLPEDVGRESLEKIVHAWYSAGAAEEPTSNKAAARKLDSSSTIISRNNKFLVAINVLEKEGKKKVLTSLGEEYAKAIRNGKSSPAIEIIDGLFEYSLTADLVDYVKINSPSEEVIDGKILELAGQEDNSAVSTQTFIEMLCSAGILIEEDGTYSARTKSEIQSEIQTQEETIDQNLSSDGGDNNEESYEIESNSEVEDKGSREPTTINRSVSYSVDIQLNVEPEDSRESVKQTINAITESLEDEELNSDEGDSQKGLGDFS